MNADASIELAWGDGTHRFRLGIAELRELQEKVNKPRIEMGAQPVGPWSLLSLARAGDLWPHESREVLRLGLIGGGKPPLDALALVIRYADSRPVLESMPPVCYILTAALTGPPGDDVGKKQDAETAKTETVVTESPSPQSMEPGQPSDGQSDKLTKPASGSSPLL